MVHQSGATGPKTDLRMSFSLINLLLKCPDNNCPEFLRAGPSGEERCTQHQMVPISLEISLLTLPGFQGAAVSSEHFSQSLPPGNVVELRGLPPLWGSLEQLERESPAGPSASGHRAISSKYTRGQCWESGSIVDYLSACKLLPNVSWWVMRTVEQGYRGTLPLPLNVVIPTLVGPRAGTGNGTRSEHSPEEGGHQGGPSSRQRVRVLEPYFIVPGKDGGGYILF